MRFNRSHTSTPTIRDHYSATMDARQVLKRMKALLPDKLKSVQAKYRVKYSASKSLRLSLVDADHLKYLQELSVVYKKWIESKINYETALMNRQLSRTLKSKPYKRKG